MTQRSITYLKGKFETNDIPTQSDYGDLIDSFVNLEASAAQTLSGKLELPAVSAAVVSANAIYVNSRIINSNTRIVSAAGTTQASATRLANDISFVFSNADERAVVLATCEPGRIQFITNTNTTTLSVFPASGGNFIGTAENTPILLAKLGSMIVAHHTASAYGVVRMQGV